MKIGILCFWIILTRVGYNFLIQGTHNGLYYIQMSNLKDICQYLGIAGFLMMVYNRQLSFKIRYLIIFTAVYCLTFACVMLYPFFGGEARSNSDQFLFAFNLFWAFAMAIMLLFLVFASDEFSTKRIST
ncbi:hypothetical protein ACFQZI_14330 [Mucilaginibacter lutimaris]|uniref:DoxX family protein n=1 Tax=Mucilaginibacter lutimaris TaxID=931629 RepID=A0ABW2ZIX1_9SPHI